MKEIIIFGTGKIAEVIHYYAHHECSYKVAAFTTDAAYLPDGEVFLDKKVVAFQEVTNHYPPSQYDMFVAIGYHDLNKLRETKCQEARDKGYNLVSIIPTSTALPSNVVYGDNCFIMPPSLIHPCVTIGNNVFVWNGAM
ncbi:MAG: transferase, partial [Bacteroidota bacterium]|nr:transferase [Bacteroidota bacterium]